MIVPAGEFQRNIGVYQDKALVEPVFVTRNGRQRTVLLSVEEYQRLKRNFRDVLAVGKLDEKEIAAIEAAEVPPEYAHLDAELQA